MPEIVVPMWDEAGECFNAFMSIEGDTPGELRLLPSLLNSNTCDLAIYSNPEPEVIQKAMEWASRNMPSDQTLQVINSLRLIGSVVYRKDQRYSLYTGETQYFLQSSTPEGLINFRIRVKDAEIDREERGLWIEYWGDNALFFHADEKSTKWMMNAINLRLTQSGHEGVMKGVKTDYIRFEKMNGHDLTYINHKDTELLLILDQASQPVPYRIASDLIHKWPSQWFKVGREMSGASLVTRIRSGQVPALDPEYVEVKAVKSDKGKYSVWVRYCYNPKPVEVEADDLDSRAEQAWVRFSESMKDTFIREFKQASGSVAS